METRMSVATTANNCLEHFMRATQDVLETVQDRPVRLGPSLQISSPVEVMEVCVILGLTGDLGGRLLFEFSRQDALSIAGAMNFGETFTDLEGMARATLCELGNLIAGRALTTLNDEGGNLSISPPFFLCGLGIRAADDNPVLRFACETGSGNMFVNISTRNKRRQA